jgi:hypothetical protein
MTPDLRATRERERIQGRLLQYVRPRMERSRIALNRRLLQQRNPLTVGGIPSRLLGTIRDNLRCNSERAYGRWGFSLCSPSLASGAAAMLGPGPSINRSPIRFGNRRGQSINRPSRTPGRTRRTRKDNRAPRRRAYTAGRLDRDRCKAIPRQHVCSHETSAGSQQDPIRSLSRQTFPYLMHSSYHFLPRSQEWNCRHVAVSR